MTLDDIERAGRKALDRVTEQLAGCYLETYGITNPWTAWLLRQHVPGWNLTQRRQSALCGWQPDEVGEHSATVIRQ